MQHLSFGQARPAKKRLHDRTRDHGLINSKYLR
jgi:hypothetical protein